MLNYYITTPIYYCNDYPHIGHAYTTIACDILARYHRLKNENVYFLTGTDEHGQKVEQAAIKKNISPKLLTDEMSKNFKKLVKFLNCTNNDFIRTSEERHKKSVQALWKILFENNQIYKGKYKGWYSIRDEAFYDEKELIKKNDSLYAPSGAKVEWLEEDSYFFKLSEWSDKLLDFYSKNPNFISPKTRYNEVISFVKSGLKDLSISRTTFNWGIPVPNDDKHIIYVWLDALQNYLSALGFPDTDSTLYKTFWPAVHIVGKDILRFHSVYWPAFLMAANFPVPKKIYSHGWWTNEGNKISKSLGNVIDPFELVDQFGLDEVRYFLFSQVPFGEDGDFSKKSIIDRINSDLANDYGNLVQRICLFIYKQCNGSIDNDSEYIDDDKKILIDSIEIFNKYKENMDNYLIDKAIKNLFKLISITNKYVDKQAPWNLKNNNIERMNNVLSISVELIKRIALMSYPIMPNKSEDILKIINFDTKEILFDNYKKINDKKIVINKPLAIFPRYEDK